MPVRVKLPTMLRKHVDGEAQVDAEGETLRDLLTDLESRYPGITKNILSDDGGLHRFVNVYLNATVDETPTPSGASTSPRLPQKAATSATAKKVAAVR